MKNRSISDFLKCSGMRERELAAAVGVRQPMINMIRHGKTRPSPKLAARLEAITGIPQEPETVTHTTGCITPVGEWPVATPTDSTPETATHTIGYHEVVTVDSTPEATGEVA